jgi:hypothetical protein
MRKLRQKGEESANQVVTGRTRVLNTQTASGVIVADLLRRSIDQQFDDPAPARTTSNRRTPMFLTFDETLRGRERRMPWVFDSSKAARFLDSCG